MAVVTSHSAIGAHIDAFADQVHESVISEWRGLQRDVERVTRKILDVAKSPDYSADGRVKHVAVAREQARAVLKPQADRVAAIKKRISDVEAEALPARPKRTADDLPALLLEQEIRGRLAGQDSLQVSIKYLDAIARGDDQFCRAVEDAPTAFPLLTAEHLAQGRAQKLMTSPQAELLDTLRAELSIHGAILEAAYHDIQTAGTGN